MSEATPPTAPSYKETLNLPKTGFDMKANLTQREPVMVEGWKREGLYKKIRDARRGGAKGKWVLHDGPPYANGDIHMGHLINKVLKDIVVKFRTMQGHDSPYVPGWDCHGLPIESAIQKELGPKFRELSKDEVRKKCSEYAMKWVGVQRAGFERLGVLGEWERPYLTLDPKYEGGILDVLAELVKKELVYRQKKPVHWCTNDRTALAEAELEYADKTDTSIYVNLKLADIEKTCPPQWQAAIEKLRGLNKPNSVLPFNLMIWTTTPWTLPANRAVAVNPKALYVPVLFVGSREVEATVSVVAYELREKVAATAKCTGIEILGEPITGKEWLRHEPKYVHPLDASRIQRVVPADYVTLEDGTGLVHTAPGHGSEDYATGRREGIEIYNPVLSDGRYDDSVPEWLKGKSIWDSNVLIVNHLRDPLGILFHYQIFNHSYPHCWRCKKPVIFRATEQWFVKASGGEMSPAQLTAALARPTDATGTQYDETMEKSSLWRNAVKFSFEATFIPEWGRNRLQGMLATRPDWCISRQRSWGVPIPAFFDAKGRCLLTEASVRRVAEHFRNKGADSWYTDSPAKILGLGEEHAQGPYPEHGTRLIQSVGLVSLGFPADVDVNTLEKGMDILDVWFESGASHHAVLECTHPELGYPAAMYLEGSDQHRGWFQSSLLEASGYKSEPPFKEVLTHGFIVDEKGRKMSKSEGNDIKVADALKQYGADVLRLWVSSVDYQNDIACGPNLLKSMGEAYRKIRNTMRYLLGNLDRFNFKEHALAPLPHSIDQWMSNKLRLLEMRVEEFGYDKYDFHRVFQEIYEFCNVEISSIYAKAVKDRLYCELENSDKRRRSQTVCYFMLVKLLELLAPILAFTSEEAWQQVRQLPGGESLEDSIHLRLWQDIPLLTYDGKLDALWNMKIMPLVEKGNKQLDELKKSVGLGNALDAEAVIVLPKVSDEVSGLIGSYGPEIEDALGVGFHRIEHGEMWDIKINDTRNLYPSCARSWKRRPDVGSVSTYTDLSKRDAEVVAALRRV